MASSRRWVISSAAARPKFLVLVFFCLDFWSVPAFVDRFHWRAGIPWGHLRGEGAWKCRSGTRCVLSLSSISAQIQKSISSVSNGGVDLGLFFVWRLLLEIWASSAHHQMIFSAIRSTCAEISWGYCWLESHVSYPHHFFLCCSLIRQRRGIIWTCFWGRFVSSA